MEVGRAGREVRTAEGSIQRSHNEMDGYAEERRGKFIRFRFAKMAKRLSYWRKRVCVSEVEGISNVVRHCAKCEKPNPLTSTDAVAERARDACTFAVRPVVSHSVIASSHLLEPIAIKLSPHDPYPVSMRSNRAFKGRTNERPKDRRRSDRDRRIQLARSLLVILSQSVVLGDTSADDSHSM